MTQLKSKIPSFTKPEEEVFNDVSIGERRLQIANIFRKDEFLTDVTLCADARNFPAHKFVLAASSDYFFTLFTSSLTHNSDVLNLRVLPSAVLEVVLNYIYTGIITLSESNVQDILSASCLLLLNCLRDKCSKFLKERIELHNCLGIFSIAKRYSLHDLCETTLAFLSASFLDIAVLDEYKQLNLDLLLDIITLENLSVPNEDYVFHAAFTWLHYDSDSREDDFAYVLEALHLPFVRKSLLEWTLESDSTVSSNDSLTQLIRKAMSYDSDQWSDIVQQKLNSWVFPRKCMEYMTSVIAMGGPTISIYNMDLDKWLELTKCKPRHCPAIDVVGSFIYLVGGSLKWKRKSTGEKFNTDTNQWTMISNMNTPRSNFGLLEHKGKLYALGGYDGNFPLRSAEVYEPNNDTWMEIPSLTFARDGACNVSDGENIYVIGGYDGSKYLTSVEYYNVETRLWNSKDISPAIIKRQNAMCVYYGGYIYYMGGYYEDNYHSTMEVLDLSTKSWSFLSPLQEPRHHAGAVAINGHIFVCGGWSGQVPVTFVDVYTISEDQWKRVAPLPTPTMVRCAAMNFPRKSMFKLLLGEGDQGISIENYILKSQSSCFPRISESSNDESEYVESL